MPAQKVRDMSGTQAPSSGEGHWLAGAAKALSGSSLGIIALALLLVDAILGIVAGSKSINPSDQHRLVAFVIVFPFAVLSAFVYLAKYHPLTLVPIERVRNQREFIAALMVRAVAPLPSSPKPWRDAKIFDADKLTGGWVTSTTLMTLFGSLRDLPRWDY
jgi:hypothetical protein